MRSVAGEVGRRLGLALDDDSDPAVVWPQLADRLADEGLVVLLKIDGERQEAAGDNGRYTLVVSRPADGAFVRAEGSSLVHVVEEVLSDLLKGSEIALP